MPSNCKLLAVSATLAGKAAECTWGCSLTSVCFMIYVIGKAHTGLSRKEKNAKQHSAEESKTSFKPTAEHFAAARLCMMGFRHPGPGRQQPGQKMPVVSRYQEQDVPQCSASPVLP